MNLIIYHLRREDVEAGLTLVEDLVPQAPPEFLLKAIVFTLIGYERLSKDHVKIAQDYFKIVGESAAECGENISLECKPLLQIRLRDDRPWRHTIF